ncbi:MAG: carotenoid biosynthesis protein [bacterium]
MQVAVKKMGEIKVWKLLVNFYIIGGLGLIIPFTRELFQQITPLSLLFSFILLLIYHEGDEKTKFFVVSILIAIVGFLVEVLGVQTGIIFGSYQYGETLGPKLFQVPLIIGINWLMLVYCIFIISSTNK